MKQRFWIYLIAILVVTPGLSQVRPELHWTEDTKPLISAHRGGPAPGYPENAIETFQHTVDAIGFCIIECDVRRTGDGELILMHDETLDRTTTGSGPVAETGFATIQTLKLKDNSGTATDYTVPTLQQVLEWARDKAILTLDVKADLYAPVIAAVRKAGASGYCVIITYTLEQAMAVHKLAPEMMISASASGVDGTRALLDSKISHSRLLAFVGVYEPRRQVYELLHQAGIRAILGTMHNLDNKAAARGPVIYTTLINNGADILATDNPVAAHMALQ